MTLTRFADHENDGYGPSPYNEQPSGYLPPYQDAGYPPQDYPSSTYFPPPPTAENAYAPNPQSYEAQQQHQVYPTYNPADYAQQQNPYGASRGAYDASEATLGAPYPNATYAGDNRYPAPAGEAGGHHQHGRDQQSPENVSAPNSHFGPAVVSADESNGNVAVSGNERASSRARDAGTSIPFDGRM